MNEWYYWSDEECCFHESKIFESKSEAEKALKKYLNSDDGRYVINSGVAMYEEIKK